MAKSQLPLGDLMPLFLVGLYHLGPGGRVAGDGQEAHLSTEGNSRDSGRPPWGAADPLSPEQNVSYHYHKIYLGGLSFHEKQKSFALFYFPKAFPHLLQPLKSLAGCHLLKAPVMRQVGFLQTSLLQMRPVPWGQGLALGVEPLGCTLGS